MVRMPPFLCERLNSSIYLSKQTQLHIEYVENQFRPNKRNGKPTTEVIERCKRNESYVNNDRGHTYINSFSDVMTEFERIAIMDGLKSEKGLRKHKEECKIENKKTSLNASLEVYLFSCFSFAL